MRKFYKKTNFIRADNEENRNLAFNYGLKYLSYRNRSTKEVYDYLKRKHFAQDSINFALKKLTDLKFINDEEFGKSWIESRQKYKGKSKLVLRQELKQKGLRDEQISPLLNDAEDDLETAKIAYRKKERILGNLPKEEFNKKMTAFLARRGYSFAIIKTLLNQREAY